MISKEEVEHIAKLARLELTAKETEKMQKDLSAILDYFILLKNVPPLHQDSAGQAPKTGNGLRKDEAVEKDNSVAEKLIAASPDKKDDYIKVKAIF